ncbi:MULTISPECIES: protease HtpX [Aliivibrio]|jgi:heat shock protein HtpX|uniref:Protease HtpX n=3 Tax=Aliivibrio TaxID=511678 RepID=HTPX_ALISL|nr:MULTISPECIES: protease HtpX [Aliivibrio]B6EKC3.1 RecName: Full=Protease HtpX; AltName: Full=Heat shock protein HtpX [Aliivibrio salmonicida LFI1238]AZL84624.1 protease HtpX [Aliivibrio salmonicida]MBB1313539.1 protease HtpX [Aliivibrio sp. SR45-2]OCH22000.1 zinc metalloprotease HtpX [Aliivibrio logei]OEF19447.1 zinc metalloprotease HtpX [Aliivibrio logei 5S-186]CAQ79007.1 heat shock protein HtpX, membrane associated peptidase [Aliivibrio salmonicida LFI1238]
MKRIALFLATNLAVMIVFSIVLNIVYAVTGIQQGSLSGLLVMAVLFGFGGSLVSLLMSKKMALRSVGGEVIEQPRNETEHWLMETVSRQAQQVGIGMPTVAIYDSPDMNAFATGAKRDDSLVAVSTGLLHNMTRDEAEAVLAHEVSHIANGDMITMTLMQGVVNTFVIFLSRMIANAVSGFTSNDEEGEGEGGSFMTYFIVSTVLEIAFGFLASFLTMWFSRHREFYADAGAANLVGKDKMIAALERLRMGQESQLEGSMMAFGINGKKSLTELLMSHPPLEKRINALRQL